MLKLKLQYFSHLMPRADSLGKKKKNNLILGPSGRNVVKNPPAKAGDPRDTNLIPGSGRLPGEGNGNPLWYSCLENSMDEELCGL